MKIINSSAEVIPMNDPLMHIEKIGRVCYKSNSDFTQDTALKFFNSLVNSGHHSVLEHATFIFKVTDAMFCDLKIYKHKYLNFTRVQHSSLNSDICSSSAIVSGNLRAICESGVVGLMLALERVYPQFSSYFNLDKSSIDYSMELDRPSFKLISREEFINSKPYISEINKHLYTTISFITDRGVSHEMVRHRPASYSQESTRYCNYSQDKFGNELTFIRPATFDEWTHEQQDTYCSSLSIAERHYLELVTLSDLRPQLARGILPTDIKTQIIMTANHEEWEHFFNLRSLGTTGNPHPNMKQVADIAFKKYKEFNNI